MRADYINRNYEIIKGAGFYFYELIGYHTYLNHGVFVSNWQENEDYIENEHFFSGFWFKHFYSQEQIQKSRIQEASKEYTVKSILEDYIDTRARRSRKNSKVDQALAFIIEDCPQILVIYEQRQLVTELPSLPQPQARPTTTTQRGRL